MHYWIDIDNNICKTEGNDYENSVPYPKHIEKVNKLYDLGNKITIWTGRGQSSGKDWKEFTEKQLKLWGVKFHEIIFCKKPNRIVDNLAVNTLEFFHDDTEQFNKLVELIANVGKNKVKILCAGNGGLSAESSHFSAELIGKYAFNTYIPCFSLSDCSPLVTALANDIGYSEVFSHQVKVLGNNGDIFIGMTTSNSLNIVKALTEAKKKGMITVVICGLKDTNFKADYVFGLHGKDTAEIQESTLKFLHKLAFESKKRLVELL